MSFRAFVLVMFWVGAGIASAQEASTEFAPMQSELPVKAPSDAVLLFDGDNTESFISMDGEAINWSVAEGTLVSTSNKKRSNHILSKLRFRDADIHVEFQLPETGHGNSGLYIHGHYELQIINSFGKEKPTQEDMGALYGFAEPRVNAARKPGEWQVYDVRFKAPRRDVDGKIVEEGSVTVWLNGQKVQDNTRFGEPRSKYHPYRHGATPFLKDVESELKKSMTGPLFLQDHDSPVRFRNVWVKPLKS